MSLILKNASAFLRNNAMLPALVCIAVIEIFIHPYLSANYFSHEVDRLLFMLEKDTFNSPMITIGDSVGHGIFADWEFSRGKIANLACNQATETTGQYFFIKRYLKKNHAPHAVISCDRTPMLGNLQQNLTENYIQRCFTEWSEVFEIARIKVDPAFTVKMIAYKLLPTFKYRLHLQQRILGSSNSNIYSGMSEGGSAAQPDNGLIRLISDYKERLREESISQHFFTKIVEMLEAENIPLYYLPPPSKISNNDTDRLIGNSITEMHRLKTHFSNLYPLAEEYKRLPADHFSDDVHLNETGLISYHAPLRSRIESIMNAALQLHREAFLHSFAQGRNLFNLHESNSNSFLYPLHEAIVHTETGMLVITSTGKDPAVELPPISAIDKETGDRVVIHIDLESKEDTLAKIYYRFDGTQPYDETKSVMQVVKSGENRLFFIFPNTFKEGQVRFDPGEREGIYVVKQAEAKLVNTRTSHGKLHALFEANRQ
ncbi:MAG: hypothetical protein KJ630_15435 [Proteobacteria bacterium]|nr:hypothetical protein [Pseudomonadota bacterium]